MPDEIQDPQRDADATPAERRDSSGLSTASTERDEYIRKLNEENAKRRIDARNLEETKNSEISALREQLETLKRSQELEKMAETERLKAERDDAIRKADERQKTAEHQLRTASIMAIAAGMDVIQPMDVAGVIDLSKIPIINGIVDQQAVQALVSSAIDARPHWKKTANVPPPVSPIGAGMGNPAPSGSGPGFISTTPPPDDSFAHMKRANEQLAQGKTSHWEAVREYTRWWEKNRQARSGYPFDRKTKDDGG